MNHSISRRELIRRGGVLGSLLAVPAPMFAEVPGEAQAPGTSAAAAVGSPGLQPGADVYKSIGVRPLVNARGTFTIISGSTMLPEVRAAMDAAAQAIRASRRAGGRRRRASGRAHRRRVGPRHERMLRGAHARHRGLRGGRQSGPPRSSPEPERLRERRGHHPDPLAQRLRRGDPRRRRCASSRCRPPRSSRRPSGRAPRSSTSWPARARTTARSASRRWPRSRSAKGVPIAGRCGGRDPDRAERAPAERRDARRLQRRQVPARAADRRPAARAQGPGHARPGSTARRITVSRARSRSARKTPSGC